MIKLHPGAGFSQIISRESSASGLFSPARRVIGGHQRVSQDSTEHAYEPPKSRSLATALLRELASSFCWPSFIAHWHTTIESDFLLFERISDRAYGADNVVRRECLSQSADMNVNGACADMNVGGPSCANQLVAAAYLTRVFNQVT